MRADDVRVPWRRSLLVRLVGVGALIAVVAIGAATWATVRATTVAVQEAQRDSLHRDARTYGELVGFAATHEGWTGAAGLVERLSRETGRRVTITDQTGRVLVDSDGGRGLRTPSRARARIDPLAVDPALLAGTEAVIATELPDSPRPCESASSCRRWTVFPPSPIDRRVGESAGSSHDPPGGMLGGQPRPARWRALLRGVDACLARAGLPPATDLNGAFGVVVDFPGRHGDVAACADQARRAWYDGRVAAPALLFLDGAGGSARVLWDLSTRTWTRIALLAGGVLLVTVALCLLLAGSVVRPLRRMAAAARRAGDGDLAARVPYRRHDEVGELARAFNRMADRRQRLEEARRRMVSDVSHELRTPLTTVRGWLEAAQDGLVETDGDLIASLHEETLQLQRLVADLHDLALGDAGELRLAPVAIDLADLLGQVASAFGQASRSAGVSLVVDSEPGGVVQADPTRLRQALDNLVSNALRYTPGGGTITLRGRTGEVEVSDTGSGIPRDELPHVFERFRRVDETRSRVTGGSGLGLAIVRQIAEAHGGSVDIESCLGHGTTVRVRLPPGAGF